MTKYVKALVLATACLALAALLGRFADGVRRSPRSVDWRPLAASASGQEIPQRVAAVERLVLERTNDERRRQGLPLLENDSVLAEVSRRHSLDMLRRDYFDHVTPEGVTPARRVAEGHRTLVGVTGENIWSGSGYADLPPGELARTIVTGWMESPGHRENILRSDYTHLGVGFAEANGEACTTQSFAQARAFLALPLAERLRPGEAVDLRVKGEEAEFFAFWPLGSKVSPDPRALTNATAPKTPGTYQLRVYFPVPPAGSYEVVFGPSVVVE